MTGLIDIWDVKTFDVELVAELQDNAELIGKYRAIDREIALERQAGTIGALFRSNPHASDYFEFEENLEQTMRARSIRAWHYTRLTDSEVDAMRTSGIYLSTLETIRQRLDAQVAAGRITEEESRELFSASPFHAAEQFEGRSNRFWLTAHPIEPSDGDVSLLLRNWGGEAIYFWLEGDSSLKEIVANLGRPRALEVRVPFDAIRQSFSATQRVVATFARNLGCIGRFEGLDLSVIRPLGPEAISLIHTEGETSFDGMGREYPINVSALSREE